MINSYYLSRFFFFFNQLLYQSPQTSSYFDSQGNQLHTVQALDAIQGFAQHSIENDKSETLAKNLTKLLLFNDIQIKALAVSNIYTLYSRHLNFYTSVNIIQPIDAKNFDLYQKFQRIHDQIHRNVINLKYVLSNENENKKLYLDELYQVFNELCDELFISEKKVQEDKLYNFFDKDRQQMVSHHDGEGVNSLDEQKLISKSHNKLYKSNGKDNEYKRSKTDNVIMKIFNLFFYLHQNIYSKPYAGKESYQYSVQDDYYHIWGPYYVDLNKLQKYQNLLANMNYHKKILDLIDFFYSQVSILKGYDHVKLQISQHCIAILIHFIIKNQSNQDLLLSESRLTGMSLEHQESVKSIAYRVIQNDQAIQQLFFVLLYQIYKNNYAELMNFTSPKSTMRSMLLEVMKSLLDKITDDKTYSIYFFDILKYFFSINGKNITQNILFLVQEISEKYSNLYTIRRITDIVNNLPIRDFKEDMKKEIEEKNESDEENEDEKNSQNKNQMLRIKFDDSAIILLTFLRTFKEMVKKSSSQIYTFVRGMFSIKQIKENLTKSQYLYPLKLEYLKFLMETYINSKQIEPQEYIEISEIVNCLAYELFYYLDMTQEKSFYEKLQLYTKFRSIFEEKYGYSTHSLVQISLLEAFEVYIIEGIVPTIKGFVDKIPSTPSDNDAKLVDILLEVLKRVHEYWGDEENYWTLEMKDEFTELKKQVGINAKSFVSPARNRESRDNVRKNSGKKRTFVGGMFGSTPNKQSPEKDQKQLQIDFNFSDKQELLAKKLKNVKDLEDELNCIVQAKLSYQKNLESQMADRMDLKLNKLKNQKKQQIFNPKLINREHDLEIDNLISIYILMKKEKPEEFRKVLQSLIDVLTKYTGKKEEAMNIRLYAMKILRKISNYKKDQKISDSIQRDLNAMGFLNFLCDVIVDEDDSKMKLEYILGLNNFMEKANNEIQMSFYKYLQDDSSNKFIRTIQNFLKSNFSQFKNYVKNNIGTNNNKAEEQKSFSKIMDGIQENCIQTMELIRLSCENHFSKMQDFFRVQIDSNNEIKTNSINIVIILADIFEKYYKVMNENNLQFGLQILDTLIELIQGPCIENQNVLCHTKLLENLEDVIADFNGKSKKFFGQQKNTRIFTQFSRKVFLLLRSLFDANEDPILISKICTYVDPAMLILKMNFTYKEYLKLTSKISRKHQGLRKYLQLMKDESQKEQALIREDKVDEEGGDESSSQKHASSQNKNINNKSNQKQKKRKEDVISKYSSDVIKYMRNDELISEGFDAYILLKNLCFLDSSFKKKYYDYVIEIDLNEEKSKDIRQTLNFYKINSVSIEIINSKGNLQKIFFRKPKLMKYFSTISQEEFLDNCERGSSQEKIQCLLENLDDFHEEMKHFLFLNSKNIFFNLTYLSWFRNLNLFVILIINLVILYEWDQDQTLYDDNGNILGIDNHQDAKNFKKFLEILQLVMSGLIYIIWLVFQFPLELKKSISNYKDYHEKTFKYKVMKQNDLRQKTDAQKQINKITSFYRKFIFISHHLIFQSHLVYLLSGIIFSVLGITTNPVFFCLLLLDVIDRSVVLRNVIKAITLNSMSLVMTAILGIIIVYIFAMIGYNSEEMKNSFTFTGNNGNLKVCGNSLDCFLIFMNFGIRNGGGISDSLQEARSWQEIYMSRFFFDLSFFVVIVIMLLNMIFGIIIDTFAELRDIKNFKDNDQKNNCFICNIERSEFENERVNFKKHNEKEHCCWNYIAYMIMLNYKDINEYDGIESYVSEKIAKQDMSWFPIGKSLMLQQRNKEDDDEDGKKNKIKIENPSIKIKQQSKLH